MLRNYWFLMLLAGLAIALVAAIPRAGQAVFTDQATVTANTFTSAASFSSELNLQSNDSDMSTATSPTGNIDTNDGATDHFTATSPVTFASNGADWAVVLVLRDKPDVAAPATINVWWQNGGACEDGTVPGQIFATGSVTVPIATDELGTTFTVPKTGGTVDHSFVSGDRLCLSISADGSGNEYDLHYYANVASTSGSSGVSRLSGPFTLDTLDPPTSLSAIATLATGLSDLSWTATVDAFADGYTILRSTSSGGPYTQIAQVTPQSTTTYQDSNLDCATTYYYIVRSYFETTESVNSNEASSTDNCTGFGATADTYVKEDKGGDDNFGPVNDIQVTSESGKLKRSLVSFDVSSIPSGSTINSATLILCLSADPQSGAQGRTHELRLVTSSWIETTVVWNDQPTVSGTATATITVPTTAQCLTFSVTADVQSWVDGTSNYGWRLSDQTEGVSNGDVDYRSRENATTDERPELKVTYTPP